MPKYLEAVYNKYELSGNVPYVVSVTHLSSCSKIAKYAISAPKLYLRNKKKYISHLGGCLAPETIAKFEAAAPEDEATVAVVVARLLREARERIVPLGCL